LVRWEGDGVVDSWESATTLVECAEAVREYWATAAQCKEVASSREPIVAQQVRQARRREDGSAVDDALCDSHGFTLAAEQVIVPAPPFATLLKKAEMLGLQVMKCFAEDDAGSTWRWWAGRVIMAHTGAQLEGHTNKLARGARRARTSAAPVVRAVFAEDGQICDLVLKPEAYSTGAAGRDFWCLIGTPEELKFAGLWQDSYGEHQPALGVWAGEQAWLDEMATSRHVTSNV
jgi:hypothetical protein